MPKMEFLPLISTFISCFSLGVMLSVYWVWGEVKRQAVVKQRELVKLEAKFAETAEKMAQSHNSWAVQIASLEDRMLAHDMARKK